MQTSFTLAQLADPDVAEADKILRACVHCGFCTATCPTYVLLGDELDSPRGRIYLIKEMLENDRPATEDVVKHIDRCLSCLACMTTCPSGVHYMHLVDHARAHIEETYVRPWPDRAMRALLANMLPYPGRFRAALAVGWLAGRLVKLASWTPWRGRLTVAAMRKAVPAAAGWLGVMQRTIAMLRLMPARLPNRSAHAGPHVFPAQPSARAGRVALLQGCAQAVLGPSINAAAVRLLTRHGIAVVLAGEGCCGSLVHHMGRESHALAQARAVIDAWTREIEGGGLDAILVTASGCGTTIKDYGYMLRNDPAYAAKAARVSSLAKDISEFLVALDLGAPARPSALTVAYQSACSLQHGQKIHRQPKDLLASAGYAVRDLAEAHLCCGSAGTYNIMQPDIADTLRARKLANIAATGADAIASGNIGCITHLEQESPIPILHTIELLDWAYGGPQPDALKHLGDGANDSRRIGNAT
jgi:glycolate oxidase iron-sulfur subunit